MDKTVAFTRDAANVFFHLLTDCNLNCRQCYINRDQHGKKRLSLKTIEVWLKLFADLNDRSNVIFLGGEPTLHPELPMAVKTARSLGYRSITIDTNGYLFNDILNQVRPAEVDYFSFSLDGATPETNDRLRGEGSYRQCLAGIRKAVSKGFSTSLIYTVSNTNIHEMEMMVPLLSDLGVDRFFIQVIGLRGKAVGHSYTDAQVQRSRWQATIPPIAEAIAKHGITVSYPKVFLDPTEPFECAGLVAQNYFIFPNGRVYRCPLCEDYPMHSMMLKDNRLSETGKINESHLFELNIPEGCVMNKLIQPQNIEYLSNGQPAHQIACCMLKEEISA
jgi:MoaA/NifB/PqqE/SkfB family radical SAM enzyme